jgi:2-aminoethylphosphonate-pyruvate transaminase
MDRDRILLTPGPLTTTLRTKLAMLRDWGSWDSRLQRRHRRVRTRLLDIIHGQDTHVVVPLQGSGTFSVEAAVATVTPRDGHVLVPDNGAYCKRAAKLPADGPQGARCCRWPRTARSPPPTCRRSWTPTRQHHARGTDPLRNRHRRGEPAAEVADVCAKRGKGLIVDAMSSFAALPIDARKVRFDALVAASGKCLEGVPGMGFVFIRKAVLDGCAGHSQSLAMDLHDQHQSTWRRPASGASRRPRTWWRRWPRP